MEERTLLYRSKSTNKKLLKFLLQFVTDERRAKFEEVISWRTRFVTVVLEDIYQSQNASAVLRTCDLCGIQDVHVIENRNPYDVNPDVTLGANKWLYLHKYNEINDNTPDAIEKLRQKGYRIVATSPHKEGFTPETLPLNKPIALLLGNEIQGLSPHALEHADAYVRIPMHGFTESYNISVSAAILLYTISNRLKKSRGRWRLNEDEKTQVLIDWCLRTIRRSNQLLERFEKENPKR